MQNIKLTDRWMDGQKAIEKAHLVNKDELTNNLIYTIKFLILILSLKFKQFNQHISFMSNEGWWEHFLLHEIVFNLLLKSYLYCDYLVLNLAVLNLHPH